MASSINEECMFDEQCMYKMSTEAECRDQICQCRDGTHFVQRENECYKSVGKFWFKKFLIFKKVMIFCLSQIKRSWWLVSFDQQLFRWKYRVQRWCLPVSIGYSYQQRDWGVCTKCWTGWSVFGRRWMYFVRFQVSWYLSM